MHRMFRRFLAIAAVAASCLLPRAADATDFTDLWFVPAESGWGVNVVQSDSFLFLTFFIYGADHSPLWYTGSLTWNGDTYAGALYATRGTFWANPWDPADHPFAQQVGTASFQPSAANAYQATLTYTVDGIGTVTRQIERQALTPIAIGGSYAGAQAGAYSGCPVDADNGAYVDKYSLGASQTTTGSATLTFSYDSGATCTLSGTLQQFGQLYTMPGAAYACSGSLSFTTTATVHELKATAQGLEGRLAATLPSGCRENANFSGVLL